MVNLVIIMLGLLFVIFFFKQKTAYEIMPSLVGSEMCIRDRVQGDVPDPIPFFVDDPGHRFSPLTPSLCAPRGTRSCRRSRSIGGRYGRPGRAARNSGPGASLSAPPRKPLRTCSRTGPPRSTRTACCSLRTSSHRSVPVSYTHLRAHETRHDLVCRLL